MSETSYMGMPIPKCYQTLNKVFEAGLDRVILYGPPGTGKTYAGLTSHIGESQSFRLVCTEDMTSAEVSGAFMPSADGGFHWMDGLATKAWRTGGRLVIDEIDKASGDVFALLLSFTDSIASASLDLPTGERIVPAPGFSVIMTSNIEHPDELPVALRDRFPVALKIDSAHPAALVQLPEELRMVAATIVASKPGRRASLRAFYAFQQLRQVMDVMEAAEQIFGPNLASSIVDAVKIGTMSIEVTL